MRFDSVFILEHISKRYTWGRTGFDGVVEVEEAGSGFSLTT